MPRQVTSGTRVWKKLLQKRSKRFKEIAAEVGCHYASGFDREFGEFENKFRATPADYR